MTPLARGNIHHHYRSSEETEGLHRRPAHSPPRERRSSDGRYSHRPSSANRRENAGYQQEFARQSQSRYQNAPSFEPRIYHHSESGKERCSKVKPKTGEPCIDRLRERRFDERGVVFAHPGQANRRKVEDQRRCIEINQQITAAGDIDAIIAIVDRDSDQFNHVNIATACNRLAKLQRGRLSREVETILKNLAVKAIENISDFKAQEIANSAWAFAKLGICDQALFEALSIESRRRISDFKSQNIANTAWAFAKLGIRNEALFSVLAIESGRKIREFNAQALANTAWAFATLGIRDDVLFCALAREAIQKIGGFKAQNIANIALAFSKLGIRDEALFTSLAIESRRKIRDFKAQEISNTALGFGKLGIRDEALFSVFAIESGRKIRDFNAQGLANTAWAFATLGIMDETLFSNLAIEAVQKIRELNAQNIANTAWAFAKLGIRNEALFSALAMEGIQKIEGFKAQNIANTTWSFATLGIRNEALFSALAMEGIQKIGDLNAQDLSNTAWGFATLGVGNRDLFEICGKNISRIDLTQFTAEELSQLGQVALYLKHELGLESFSWPDGLSSLIRDAKRERLNEIHSSKFHQDCSRILRSLGHSVQDEYTVNGLVVDIYLEEKNLLIEVDGPSHFAYNTRIALGYTLFKKRLLNAMRYPVVSIPYWEWNELKSNGAKKRYLESKLASSQLNRPIS